MNACFGCALGTVIITRACSRRTPTPRAAFQQHGPRYHRLMLADVPRPLTRQESELLGAFLDHDFRGVEALRARTRGLLAKCGCTADAERSTSFLRDKGCDGPPREIPSRSRDTCWIPTASRSEA